MVNNYNFPCGGFFQGDESGTGIGRSCSTSGGGSNDCKYCKNPTKYPQYKKLSMGELKEFKKGSKEVGDLYTVELIDNEIKERLLNDKKIL